MTWRRSTASDDAGAGASLSMVQGSRYVWASGSRRRALQSPDRERSDGLLRPQRSTRHLTFGALERQLSTSTRSTGTAGST